MRRRLTTEEFISRAKEIHGCWYGYDNVEYINDYTKVLITCPVHGNFEQRPSSHLQGNGCPKCAGNYPSYTEDFIRKAKQIHGDKYSYDRVNYVDVSTKVIITCPIHEDFEQEAGSHLQGKGCAKCAGNKKSSTQEFMRKAKQVHKDKYGYDKVDYFSCHSKVTITCLVHGDFEQQPNSHLQGQGCRKCGWKQ